MSTARNQTKGVPVFRNIKELKKKEDRRVRRTRDRLGDSLMQLLLQKPFDKITVQDVLDRAGVSRATFYSHFRDKNDLFLSDTDEFFEGLAMALAHYGCRSERVAPVQELFAHISDVRAFHRALSESGKLDEVWELGREHFARGIERRLDQIPRAAGIPLNQRAPLAHALAGSLVTMLMWWVRHDMTPSPKEMDTLFHKLVWSGVNGART
jgi:AcrR family transcriptional regulator